MAATAWLYEYEIVGSDPVTGAPIVNCRAHISDPAVPISTQRPIVVAVTVAMNNSQPSQYGNQVKDAIIAAGAAQAPPFTMSRGDVLIGAFG